MDLVAVACVLRAGLAIRRPNVVIPGFRFAISGLGLRDSGFEFRVSVLGFLASGSGF